MTSSKCQHGRLFSGGKTTGPQGRPEPTDGGRFYCSRHTAERMAALELLPPEKRLKPTRFAATYWTGGDRWE